MSDDINADADRLLASFDFSQAMAAAEATRKREFNGLLLGFLEVLDPLIRLDRAAGSSDPEMTAAGLLRTLGTVVRNAMRVLREQGVEPVRCLGEHVDLNTCEVIDVRADVDHTEDTVIDEVQRGYLRHGRLIRRAKVIIAGPLVLPPA
jgi:molecular chaperone GrpE